MSDICLPGARFIAAGGSVSTSNCHAEGKAHNAFADTYIVYVAVLAIMLAMWSTYEVIAPGSCLLWASQALWRATPLPQVVSKACPPLSKLLQRHWLAGSPSMQACRQQQSWALIHEPLLAAFAATSLHWFLTAPPSRTAGRSRVQHSFRHDCQQPAALSVIKLWWRTSE